MDPKVADYIDQFEESMESDKKDNSDSEISSMHIFGDFCFGIFLCNNKTVNAYSIHCFFD